MEGRSLKIVYIILILCIFLSACNKKMTNNSKDTLFINSFNAISKEGIVVSDNGVMTYYDYITGKETVLCTRLQCNHEVYDKDTNPNPDCPAVSSDKYSINCVFIADGILYFTTEGPRNSEKGLMTSKLYKADLNGENRVYLGVIDYDFRVFDTYIYENYIFGIINSIKVVSNEEGIVNTESTLQAVAINLNTLETVYLSEPDEITDAIQPYVYDGKLFCAFINAHNDMSEIRIFSLEDFTLIDTIQAKGYSYIKYSKDYMYYSYFNEGTEEINLCKKSLRTGKVTTLHIFKDSKNVSCGLSAVTGNYIFYRLLYYDGVNPAEDRGTYVFDMKDDSINEIDFSYSGIYTPVFAAVDDEHILLRYTEKGKVVYRYMKAVDFIDKSMDFIDIRPSQ